MTLAATLLVGALAPIPAAAAEFDTGANIFNADARPYDLVFPAPRTTAVCEVRRPTPQVQRGLVAAAVRRPNGLKFQASTSQSEALATIAAQTRVDCLCVRKCKVRVVGVGEVEAQQGATIIIENGQLRVERVK